jgi:endonuclease YncB( thermonuclease family)
MISYQAKFLRGIDGDTAVFDLSIAQTEIGRKITKTIHDVHVRFLGINTPEKTFSGYSEARDYTISRLSKAGVITIETDDSVDVFDRLLGVVYVDGVNLNQELLDKGLAVVYKRK